MTATEIKMRFEEASARLRTITDKFLEPLVDRTYTLLLKHGFSPLKYPFTDYRGDFFYDWGHYLRAHNRKWSWVDRVLSWNPCNHIGQLRGF